MKKTYWLDLELREDIDDLITLEYALTNNSNIKVLSIHNPSRKELQLAQLYREDMLKRNGFCFDLVINGEITEYETENDLSPFIPYNVLIAESVQDFLPLPFEATFEKDVAEFNAKFEDPDKHFNERLVIYKLEDYIKKIDMKGMTVFCGGSLNTLSVLADNFDCSSFEAYVQGGFASYKIVGSKNTLNRFKDREDCPTWNLNLDIEATDKVLKSDLKIKFISKNICHSAWVHKNDILKNTNMFSTNRFKTYLSYLSGKKSKKKCLHDVLAFMSIENKELVEFKEVVLNRNNDDIPKWWSELETNSKHSISVSYNYDLFLDNFIKTFINGIQI
ncbi:MAG: hypothetical protein CL760_05135 [Chloroflexi bacterium]|nr:hypothetical protein [Chloroflexota bacterium]|tara:strand:- start:4666 stop:5664 length:999 start_codon:yes stop_codon:yes gene_type:complete